MIDLVKPNKKFDWGDWLCRLPLALVFIYAACEKITDPAGFAGVIDNYRFFPAWAISPLAICLPWLELWAGMALFFNRWKNAGAFIIALLTISFMAAVGFNLGRGLDFECGCFGVGGRKAGTKLLIQDGILLILAAAIFFKNDGLSDSK